MNEFQNKAAPVTGGSRGILCHPCDDQRGRRHQRLMKNSVEDNAYEHQQ
jgi:hypothetical protein